MKKTIAVIISVLLLAAVFAGCAKVNTGNAESGAASQSAAADGEKYYHFSSGLTDAEIEQFAEKIKDAMLNGDWETVAANANYPLRVGTAVYDTAEDFLAKEWDGFFSDEWKEALEAETCHEMGFNGEGFMLASGEVWVFDVTGADGGEQLLIWSINS